MKKAVLDLKDCKCLGDLHQKIKKALDFPDYYGENWSAFWDCINRDCDIEFITIIGISSVSSDLNPHVTKMIEILERNKQYYRNTDYPFDYEVLS